MTLQFDIASSSFQINLAAIAHRARAAMYAEGNEKSRLL